MLSIAAKHLEPLKGGKIPMEILVTSKDQEQKAKAFEKCLDVIKSAGVRPFWQDTRNHVTIVLTSVKKKVGTLPKDTAFGPFADEWKRAFGDISKEIEEVDIAPALSAASFSIKGPEELVCSFLV